MNLDAVNAELSRRSLLAFAQRMEHGYEAPPHLRLLTGLLEQLERGDIRRLCVSMPPRTAKTTTCSQLFPAWAIGRDSKRTVILANHSAELAASFSRKAKGYIESPLWPFSKIALSEDSRAVHRWNVTPGGGGLYSVGVGSGITGIGCDYLVIDDPINDALSQTERDLAWQWYQNVAFPRCNAGARILVVSARLAVDDLPGRLMESDDAALWRFCVLPAFNAPDNELGLPGGEPLWERFGHEELRQRREAMGASGFNSQYLQAPELSSGGRIFSMEDFGLWTQLPKAPQRPFNPLDLVYDDPLRAAYADSSCFVKISAMDLAGTENATTGGSWSAIVTVLCNLITGEIYVLDCERWRNIEFSALRNNITLHLARHGPNSVLVEFSDPTGGRMLGDLGNTTRWPIRGVKAKTSKVDRALQVVGMVEAHKLFLPARDTEGVLALKKELAAFGPGASTLSFDCVDSFIWACLGAKQYVAARREDDYWEREFESFSLFG